MTTASDLDLPLLPSAEQIRRREFASVRRGYDPDQVRDYLEGVATQVETLEHELREVRMIAETAGAAPSAVAAPQPATPAADPYEELGKRVAGLIASADQEALRLLDEAKTDSSRVLNEARAEADRIRTDAQSQAETERQQAAETLTAARAKADAILEGLSGRREHLVTQLQSMQTRLLNVAKELDVTIEDGGASASSAVSTSAAPVRGRTDSAAVAEGDALADLVDPRYEDLWVSPDAEADAVDIPDLASMELDFDSDDD